MTCTDCTTATQRPHYQFSAGCQGCCARAAARSPHYRRCQELGMQDSQYRRLLAQFELTHEQVREAARADKCS